MKMYRCTVNGRRLILSTSNMLFKIGENQIEYANRYVTNLII